MKKVIAIVAVVAVALVALSSYNNNNEVKANKTDKFVAELKNGGTGNVIIGGNKKLD